MKIIIFLIIFVFPIYSSNQYICLVDGLRIRSQPSIKAKILRKIEKGEILDELLLGKTEIINSVNGNWIRIRDSNKKRGWVFGGYLNRFIKIDSPSGYSISYPEKWQIYENTNTDLTQIQIISYNDKKEFDSNHYIPTDEIKINILIFNNVNSDFEEWARSIDYINKIESINDKKDEIIAYSKSKNINTRHILKKYHSKFVLINYVPQNSTLNLAAQNIINSFILDIK